MNYSPWLTLLLLMITGTTVPQDLPPIRFEGILWNSSTREVQQTLADKGLSLTYHYEDGTLVHNGPWNGVETGVFSYFTEKDELVRFNLLLNGGTGIANVTLFRKVRAEFIERYARYERILNPAEQHDPGLDGLNDMALATLARSSEDSVWSAWRHVSTAGDTTMVEIRLVKLTERPPPWDRLVIRIWYYGPRWFREK